MVAHFQILHHRAHFLHNPGKLMAEGRAYTGIRHQAVIKVQIRPAYAAAGNADDGILGMQYLRNRFLYGAYPVRAAIIHC